jgi:hypothetical protein
VNIGIIAEPERHRDWPAIKAFLEPAAKRGGVPVLEPHEEVWAIYDPQLVGAATARLTSDGFGEVVLVGGRDFRRWLGPLDALLGEWMALEGMKSIRAYGRKGWRRILKNWTVIGSEGDAVGYERVL